MVRALTVATAIATICGVLAAFGSSAAVAAPPAHGTLTSTEYKRLATAIDALKQSLGGKKPNWQAAERECQALGSTTPLLDTQRRSCTDELAMDVALLKFEVDQDKCASRVTVKKGHVETTTTPVPTATATTPGVTTATPTTTVPATTTPTTTTPTTTTPTTATRPASTSPGKGVLTQTDLKLVACLNPDSQALGRLAGLNYSIDVVARKDAVARGFTGKCLATLVWTAAQIRDEESFAFTAKHFAADVALITKVEHGKASPSKLNGTWIEDDARDFADAAATVENEKSPQQLSACSHAQVAT